MAAYINNAFVQKPLIPLEDLGFLRGYGVFEYLRTYNGHLFHLKEHILRLIHSAQTIGLSLPKTFDEMIQIAKDLATPESTVRLIITGGASADGLTSPATSFYGISASLPEKLPPLLSLRSTQLQRFLPAVKTLNYIPAMIALKQAKEKGFQDALYLTPQGELLEATTSNLFVWKGNRLITSNSDQILRGITRALILRLAREEFLVEERPLFYEELFEITEAFISSSIKEIIPISQIDTHQFLTGRRTKRLKELFAHYTAFGKWEELLPDSYLSHPLSEIRESSSPKNLQIS